MNAAENTTAPSPQRCAAERCVAIFASREDPHTLRRTLVSVNTATRGTASVDILVNGNPDLANAMCRIAADMDPLHTQSIRVWSIALGDKAHAWNQYVHGIWRDAAATFFVDGYVTVNPDAFDLLVTAAASTPDTLAAAAVPTTGRTAASVRAAMLRDGGLHGNLFMLTSAAMRWTRASGFRLPIGLYRTDATLGAALAFGLDPSSRAWEPKRYICVEPRATWSTANKRWWSYEECMSQIKRIRRQAQGVLENAAVQHLLSRERRPACELPTSVETLVGYWAEERPLDVRRLTRYSPLRRRVLAALLTARHRPSADFPPTLAFPTEQSVKR